MTSISVHAEDVERLKREHHAAVTALREIRDNSISWDDAIHIAVDALRHCGVIPQPKFEEQIADMIDGLSAKQDRLSLGDGVRLLAVGEGITQRMLTNDFRPVPQELVDDVRCASCERNGGDGNGPAGLCDGCLDALGDAA